MLSVALLNCNTTAKVDYQYDLDGNPTYKSDGVNTWTYSYDDQDRLVGILEADGSTTEYEYDIFGNRIATVYNGERTEYLVDPFGYGDVVGEYDGSGNLTAEYTHGIGLVSRTDSSNVAAYYDFNATGSAVGLTGTGGEVLNRYGYLPYGESLFESESIDNSFEFVGQWGIMEEANGLDFMRARYYSPSEGRFLNTDPIGLAGGDTNIYRYVNNSPLNFIDPSGLIGAGGNVSIMIGGGAGNGILGEFSVSLGSYLNRRLQRSVGIDGGITTSVFGSNRKDSIYGASGDFGVGAFFTPLGSGEGVGERLNRTKRYSGPLISVSLEYNDGNILDEDGNNIGRNIFTDWRITLSDSATLGVSVSDTGNGPGGGSTIIASPPLLPPIGDTPTLPSGIPGINYDVDGEENSRIEFVPPPYTEDAEDRFEEAEDQIRRRYYDPLIMDLDGDGIELTSLENSKVYFDIDGDGFREKTGWVKSDDGLLVLDRNNDGYINDISELFGNQIKSGFTELQELDSNNDGQITATDTKFADLQVWRDIDEDGRSDVKELYSLAELNITRIDAFGNPISINREGHLINETGSFELADGTQLEVANVWMNLDQQDSYYDHNSTFNSPVVFTEQILNLPNLKGYGNLPDLRIAMAKDSELVTLVESLTESANSGDISKARELMRPILLRWAGVNVSSLSSNSFYAFDYELEFLEKFVGRAWNNNDPSAAGRTTIRNTFASLESELETRLLAQVAESSVDYNTISERYEFGGDIKEAIAQFKQVAISTQASNSETLDFQATALAEVIQQKAPASNLLFSEFTAAEDATLEVLATDILSADLDRSSLSFSFHQFISVWTTIFKSLISTRPFSSE